VSFGFRILEVEGVAERLQGHVVGVFEILHGVAQHFGAGADHFFKALVIAFGLLKGAAVVERALHGREQLVLLEGLEEIIVSAPAHGVDGHADVVHGRDHDDGKVGLESVNALEQGDAVDILHDDVGEHQVEDAELECFEGFASSTGHFDVVSLALERSGDHGPHRGFVIDHENPLGLAHGLLGVESGRGGRLPRICELGSQTPACIFFAHLLPLIRLARSQRL
jgi:hypothetical protein